MVYGMGVIYLRDRHIGVAPGGVIHYREGGEGIFYAVEDHDTNTITISKYDYCLDYAFDTTIYFSILELDFDSTTTTFITV